MSMSEKHSESFVKVRVNSLNHKEPIPFDIYVRIQEKQILYVRAGDKFTSEQLAKFENKGQDSLFIKTGDRQNYKEYVHEQLRKGSLDAQQKAIMLRESSLALIEELYESPDIENALKESSEIITEFVDLMGNEPDAMAHLIGLSSHDFYTYTHSLDVGVYSLGLAKVAGFSPKDLQLMGEGALFHDIGKRNVSVDIICKNGPLDEIEWAQMQKHPEYGLKILTEHNANDALIACCFEHHESVAGNGYPQALSAKEIHPMAKIVALTDTFDALTTQRSYNKPMKPSAALEFMRTKLAGRYDEDMLRAMYEVLFQMEKKMA